MATLHSEHGEFLRTQEVPVSPLGLHRLRLLQYAGAVMGRDADTFGAEDFAQLSQTLLAALELLKVADEELREERRLSATIQAAQDLRLAHLEAMFAFAPAALVLTTSDTTIRQANTATARLFGVDTHSLSGTRICDMVPRSAQQEFRKQLALAIEMGSVEAWSFVLQFRRSRAAPVAATLHVIDDAAVGTRALYWNLRPMSAKQAEDDLEDDQHHDRQLEQLGP